jgi:hypothetical protein
MTSHHEVVTELRANRPPRAHESIMDSVLSHLAEPPRALEEPQWIMMVTVIVAEAADPWNDDEARGAISAHAGRSTLTHARRAVAARGRRRQP